MGVEIGALGFDHDMTDVAGIACVAVEQSAVEDDATSDAGRHDHADEVRHAAGPALPCLTERKRLASLSTCTARPVCSASRVRSGKSRHTGMLIGDTASPACRMGPPQPTPQTRTDDIKGCAATSSRSSVSRTNSASASATSVDGSAVDRRSSRPHRRCRPRSSCHRYRPPGRAPRTAS